jgi:hypothetical protein
MRRVLWAAALAAVVVDAAPARAATVVEVPELVFAADRYDGQDVEVRGEVRRVRRRQSKSGREYTLFRLESGGRWVNVFAWDCPELVEGRPTTVVGLFHAVKQVGEWTFKKEIEASEVR